MLLKCIDLILNYYHFEVSRDMVKMDLSSWVVSCQEVVSSVVQERGIWGISKNTRGISGIYTNTREGYKYGVFSSFFPAAMENTCDFLSVFEHTISSAMSLEVKSCSKEERIGNGGGENSAEDERYHIRSLAL